MSKTKTTHATMDELIDRHYRAEERGDVHGAVADLADDVDHELAGTHRANTRTGAEAFYQDLFARLRLHRIASRRRLYGVNIAVDEVVVDAHTASGEPTPFRLLHVFEFEDGRITRESAWQAALD